MAPLQDGSMSSLWSSEPFEPGRPALQLSLLAHPGRPTAPQWEAAHVLSTLELSGTLGAWRGFDVTAGLALHRGAWEAPPSPEIPARVSTLLGDVRFVPRLQLWTGISALLAASYPVARDPVVAREGLRFEPRLLGTLVVNAVKVTANLGYLLHAPIERFDSVSSDSFVSGAGARLALSEAWSAVTEVVGRWYPSAKGSAASRVPTEAQFAMRFSVAGWAAQLGGGVGLLGGSAQPDWRMTAALSFSLPEAFAATTMVAPPDRDRDGVPDTSDACADEREDRNGIDDFDGCPDAESAEASTPSPQDDPAPEIEAATPDQEGVELAPLPVLRFERNQVNLNAAQLAILDVVATRMMEAPPEVRFIVEGHSDDTGPAAFNQRLSRSRALSVRLQLMHRGISWRRLGIVARGSSDLLDTPDTSRRVKFRLVRSPQR